MKKMRILVACESSGVVRDAFISRGHDAVSCDLLPSERPGPHIQGDVRPLLDESWDMIIAHPPCTYLCSSGLHWNWRIPGRHWETEQALSFVRLFLYADCPRIALENPVGRIGKVFRPADQYIHPWMFGHDASKKTGLWLKGLPLLVPTNPVAPRYVCPCGARVHPSDTECAACGTSYNRFRPRWANQTDSGQNRLTPSVHRWKERSRTYQGIADAMATQWG